MSKGYRWLVAIAVLQGCAAPAPLPTASLHVQAAKRVAAFDTPVKTPLVVQPEVIVAAAAAFRDPNPALQAMVRSALLNTGMQIVATDDGTAYVKTGDIPAEWLRDASVQVEATYLGYAHDAQIRRLFKAVIQRQAKYLMVDAYANAFKQDYSVWERKFELDSLCYPVLLVWKYYQVTGDASVFTPEVKQAFLRVLDVMEIEQDHAHRSAYRFKSDTQEAGANPVAYTGMIWTGFRPSDDPCVYNFLIPSEMMAVQALSAMRDIAGIYRDASMATRAETLRQAVHAGIQRYGIVEGPGGKPIYAYEVDGLGHAQRMDDANLPNLLAAPYVGYVAIDDPIYQNTRRFVLSMANPYFYSGALAAGLGSPHTPAGMIWPLGLLAEGFSTNDRGEQRRVLAMLVASDPGDHRLHESFDPSDPRKFTREDFGWPNAFFTEYIAKLRGAPAHPVPSTSGLRFDSAARP